MSEIALFKISVKGIVLDDSGKVMLLREESDKWDLPGGTIEMGESYEQTLKREIKEEMGVDCELLDSNPCFGWPTYNDLKGTPRMFICFRIKLTSQNFVKSKEFQEYKYFSKDELSNVDMFETTKGLIEHL